ncbi:ribonuclease TUDOR 1-like isoform X2 [Apium graveolens]|uniref:ribonuclease TUDOR 1-like isoform X2 n=1 Tax=Apium graveolens TaxID=4045 RepID=UPI003D7A08FE
MLRGIVKAVPSGDTLVIMELGNTTSEIPPERTVILSSLMAPRLARRGGKQTTDEPFAWQSREFLRKLCIGKVVSFQIDYTLQPGGLEFGTVFLGNNNIASWVVAHGWAKVREVRDMEKDKGEFSPHLKVLRNSAIKAMNESVGIWSKAAGAVRNLPPSAVDDPENLDVMDFLDLNKGRIMEAIVEYVRDGSTLHVYLLPDYLHVRVYVAGIQAPPIRNRITEPEKSEANEKTSKQPRGPLASEQKVTASSAPAAKSAPDTFGRESKHFTELRVLHRDVRIVFEGFDKLGLIGSVYYLDGIKKDLAVQLVENGLAKYVERCAHFLQDNVKQLLKRSELAAKESRLRMWTNYTPPPTTARKVEDQNFSGKVVEVVSGDCILVATNSLAERRVYLSSIRRPRLGNSGSADRGYAREAKEFLRKHLIGRQVHVSMEYSRKVNIAEGRGAPKHPEAGVMDFGSIFVESQSSNAEDSPPAQSAAGSQRYMTNIAQMMVAHGLAEVIRHKDYEARSNHYEALFAAEFHARAARKGMHSGKDAPVITDFLTSQSKKASNFLPELQQDRKINAVVEYLFSGHRYKLYIPQKACYIAFSLSRVRCPGRDTPFLSEATELARRIIMQRDVEIDVETVDRSGTFLGSLWESESNVAVTLLEHGLAKLQTSFNTDKITNFHQLAHAEQSAKRQKLKIWKSYVERQDVPNDQYSKRILKEDLQENCVKGQEVSNDLAVTRKPKEVLQVVVKEVLGGGRFYVQTTADQKAASTIQQKLASLRLQEPPAIGSYNPKKDDLVIAQFSQDNSWYRAMVVNVPRGIVRSAKAKFEVFFIDYGTQEFVAYSRLRPSDCYSLPSSPGLAKLCSLAHIKVPDWAENYGKEAAHRLSDLILHGQKFKAIVEEKDTSDGEVRGHGTGTNLMVTLMDTEANISINALMVKEGFGRVDERRQEDAAEKQTIEELKAYQEEAKKERLGMWENGDIISDDNDENE